MILVLYNIILITNFKLIEMCIKSSPQREGRKHRDTPIGLRRLSFQVKQIDSGTSALSKLVKESHLTP